MPRNAFRILALALLASTSAAAQQMADPRFHPKVEHPAYASEHPKVGIDEAHLNFHTADGRYKPFADLLRADGYDVGRNEKRFTSDALKPWRVLVIANALGTGANAGTDTSAPAFTETECGAVREWVRGGGSLLLISDHTPFGAAAEMMGRAFGVQMGKGFVYSLNDKYAEHGRPSLMIYSRDNGLLGDHVILLGRNDTERVRRVLAFTGQSLSVPENATTLLKIAPDAHEAPTRAALQEAAHGGSNPSSTPGSAQGLAMPFGKGRVVVLGEAALLSAQIIRFPNGDVMQMGMNAPGSDDRQFALNVLHWLSGLLN